MPSRFLMLSVLLFTSGGLLSQAHGAPPHEDVVLTMDAGERRVEALENGRLRVDVRPGDVRGWKSRGWVRYSDLGATGDDQSDDMNAIAAAHAVANRLGLPVRADSRATYHIGGEARTAVIQTSTDFGDATFIIDDTKVANRNAHVFLVSSALKATPLEGVKSLKRNQKKLDVRLPATSLITVTNAKVKRYIRMGANRNDGAAQTDIFIVDQNGRVDMKAPIIWDFDEITEITALPIDPDPLFLKGGRFTTVANQAESKYTYYKRGIGIRRSTVMVDGLEHRITGEGGNGAPYGGFLDINNCAQVTVRNSLLSGHKTYVTIGSAGVSVAMGTYDINVNRAINVSFVKVRQINDINDRSRWGIMGSNYSKNLLYDQCTLSRFDAHMGVANATIRGSTLGHQGINAIGTGTFLIEQSTINGGSLITLRGDYGSTWEGDFIILDCVFVPSAGNRVGAVHLIGGVNTGQHDFGYTCHMPARILMENLRINDSSHHANYQGPAIFANFNPQMTSDTYVEKFPYVKTREVVLRNVTTASGKPLRTSDNPFMFKEVKVTHAGS